MQKTLKNISEDNRIRGQRSRSRSGFIVSVNFILVALFIVLSACTNDEPSDYRALVKGKKGINIEILFDVDYYLKKDLTRQRLHVFQKFQKNRVRYMGSYVVRQKLIVVFRRDKHLQSGKTIIKSMLNSNYSIKEVKHEKYVSLEIKPKHSYRLKLVNNIYKRFILIVKRRMALLGIGRVYFKKSGDGTNVFVHFHNRKYSAKVLRYIKLFQDLRFAKALKIEQCKKLKCFDDTKKIIVDNNNQHYVYRKPEVFAYRSVDAINLYSLQSGGKCLLIKFYTGRSKLISEYPGSWIWITKKIKLSKSNVNNSYNFLKKDTFVSYESHGYPFYEAKSCKLNKSIAQDLLVEYKYGNYYTPVGVVTVKYQ